MGSASGRPSTHMITSWLKAPTNEMAPCRPCSHRAPRRRARRLRSAHPRHPRRGVTSGASTCRRRHAGSRTSAAPRGSTTTATPASSSRASDELHAGIDPCLDGLGADPSTPPAASLIHHGRASVAVRPSLAPDGRARPSRAPARRGWRLCCRRPRWPRPRCVTGRGEGGIEQRQDRGSEDEGQDHRQHHQRDCRQYETSRATKTMATTLASSTGPRGRASRARSRAGLGAPLRLRMSMAPWATRRPTAVIGTARMRPAKPPICRPIGSTMSTTTGWSRGGVREQPRLTYEPVTTNRARAVPPWSRPR